MSRALLLDAGNTVVFLDHDAVGALAGVSGAAIRDAEGVAKRRYAERLARAAERGQRAIQPGATQPDASESGDSEPDSATSESEAGEPGVSEADAERDAEERATYARDTYKRSPHEAGWRIFMRTLLQTAGVPKVTDKTLDSIRAAHDEYNLWRRVPADLVPALDRIRAAGWRVGIVSNSEGRLPELFELVGLDEQFEIIVDSHNVGVAKPDPAIFQVALRAMKMRPEDVVYAGDIPEVDIEGAHAAGLDSALIDPLGYYPDFDGAPRFESVAQLVDALLSGD